MTSAHPDGDPFADRSFEELVAELEDVTRQMDSGSIGVEAAADLYVRARSLHEAASERLARVRRRLEELTAEAERSR